jgi:hypothetical protein
VNRQRRIHGIVCVSAVVFMNIPYLQNNVNCLGTVTKMFVCTCQRVNHTRVQLCTVLCTSDYPEYPVPKFHTFQICFKYISFSLCSACIVQSIWYRLSFDANIRKKVLDFRVLLLCLQMSSWTSEVTLELRYYFL